MKTQHQNIKVLLCVCDVPLVPGLTYSHARQQLGSVQVGENRNPHFLFASTVITHILERRQGQQRQWRRDTFLFLWRGCREILSASVAMTTTWPEQILNKMNTFICQTAELKKNKLWNWIFCSEKKKKKTIQPFIFTLFVPFWCKIPARSSWRQPIARTITKPGWSMFGQSCLLLNETKLWTRTPCRHSWTHCCLEFWNYGAWKVIV